MDAWTYWTYSFSISLEKKIIKSIICIYRGGRKRDSPNRPDSPHTPPLFNTHSYKKIL